MKPVDGSILPVSVLLPTVVIVNAPEESRLP